MGRATALYTLGDEEVIQCHKCGKLFRGESDMEITVHPDGITVVIRCENCPEEDDHGA